MIKLILKINLLTLVFLSGFLNSYVLAAGSSTNYKIAAEVLDGGGMSAQSASYRLLGKTRGASLQSLSSAGFILNEGFLRSGYFAAPVLAPIVTSVSPATAVNNKTISVTISGANFASGAGVKISLAGAADVTAINVVVAKSTSITCDLPIIGAKAGLWTVTVTNSDGRSGSLASAFKITYAPPSVTAITPAKGFKNETVKITNLAGENFWAGAAVKLSRTGESDIAAEGVVVVSSTQITCSFNLTGKNIGIWDVVVTNEDGASATLSGGFRIEEPKIEIVGPVVADVNPFNPLSGGQTKIKYTLSKDSNITIYVYNMRGERVWEWNAPAGTSGGNVGENSIAWDGITTFKATASVGVYFVHITTRADGAIKTLGKMKLAVIKW